jgi:two-component system, cell cycle sensor histidine kinase and response regulator CckA
MTPISRRQRQALIVGTALAILAVGAAVIAIFASRVTTQQWVSHTYEVIQQSERLVSGLVDAETGQRGYLLTGDEAYLGPYRKGLVREADALRALRSLVADNPPQERRIDSLDSYARAKTTELAQTIELRRSQGPAAASALVATGRGRASMDSVRRLAADVRATEQGLLAQRQGRADRLRDWVFLVAGLGTVLGVALTLLQGGLLSRAVTAQEALTAELADRARVLEDTAGELEMSNEELHSSNEQLQSTVEELQTTTEELESANEELEATNDELHRSRLDLEARQDRLARSEARFRSLVVASAQAVWWTDADGLATGALPEWETLVGATSEDRHGAGWLDAVHPEDRERTVLAWRHALRTRTPFEITHRIRRRDGQYRVMTAHAVPVAGGDGQLGEWIGAHADVTERERATAALRQSEEQFRTLAEHLPVSLFVCRPDGGTEYVNPAWTALTGVPAREARTAGWAATVHEADWPRVMERWRAALAGEAVELNYRHVRPDGSVRHVRTTSQAVRDGSGQVMAILGTGLDLTERFEQEEQLRHAQRMQAVGRLAGGMAHELNNMLTAGIGFGVYALRNLPADHPAVRDIGESLKAQERAARITSQVLSFSRRQMLAPSRFELKDAVQDLVPLLQQSLEPGQTLQLLLADDLGAVYVDRTRLDQAVLNLVLNARDAMPNGGTLTLRTRRAVLRAGGLAGPEGERLRPGPYLVISLEDTGDGMDPETRRRALEPFFTTKAVGQGTGLGLSMAYGFARQSEGTLIIESDPGHGTTVNLYLPLAPAEAETPAEVASGGGRPDAPSGEHILVVDDEPSVRAAMRRALEEQGYEVIEAGSGAEAIVSLAQAPGGVHLVVCDLIMPQMSGGILGATIRERWPALPVLYVSGFPGAEGDEAMMPAGAPFLKKPFSPEALTARVRAVLDGR